MIEGMGLIWCRWWHKAIAYAGGAFYVCRTCQRKYAVPWAKPEAVSPGVYVQAVSVE